MHGAGQSRSHSRQLPETPHRGPPTSSQQQVPAPAGSRDAAGRSRDQTRRQQSAPAESQNVWQRSLPRWLHRDRTTPPPTTTTVDSDRQRKQPSSNKRSSSALAFSEQHFQPVSPPQHRPVAQTETTKPKSSLNSEPVGLQQRAGDPPASPRPTLARRVGNFFRRSKSATNSRHASPSPTPSLDSKDWSEDEGLDSKAGKVKSARRKLAFTRRHEHGGDVIPMRPVVHYTVPSIPSTPRTPSSVGDMWSSEDHVSTADDASTSSPSMSTNRDCACAAPPNLSDQAMPPATPTKSAIGTPFKSPPGTPHQLNIRLTAVEKTIIAKRYVGRRAAANEAVADIEQLMTSSRHVTNTPTPTSITSASDSDLVSGASSSLDSVASGISDEAAETTGTGSRSRLVSTERSFRRTELVPTIRRLIATCQRLSAASTCADRADQFSSLLTESVHAFTVMVAVSRRAGYSASQRDQLNDALQQCADSYCEMMCAAGSAVGEGPADAPAVLVASEKAAGFAERLSSLLITVKHLKSGRGTHNPRLVFF